MLLSVEQVRTGFFLTNAFYKANRDMFLFLLFPPMLPITFKETEVLYRVLQLFNKVYTLHSFHMQHYNKDIYSSNSLTSDQTLIGNGELMDWSDYDAEWYKEHDPVLYKHYFTEPKPTLYLNPRRKRKFISNKIKELFILRNKKRRRRGLLNN